MAEQIDNELLKIGSRTANNVVHNLLRIGSPVSRELLEKMRGGGELCIADNPGTPLLVETAGQPDPRKGDIYKRFCQEKAARLGKNSDHARSWQSRDPDNMQYGGAIRAGGFIISFSGLPEDLDEIVSAIVAWKMGLLRFEWIRSLLEGNTYLDRFTDEQIQALAA